MSNTNAHEQLIDAPVQLPPDGTDLQIPESRDGFFGYPEEKSLQQVRMANPISLIYAHIHGCQF
jgi:hypothetical protein